MDNFDQSIEDKNELAYKGQGSSNRRDDPNNIKGKKKHRPRGSRGGASKRIRKQKIAAKVEAQFAMNQNTSEISRSHQNNVGKNHLQCNQVLPGDLPGSKNDNIMIRSYYANQNNHSNENNRSTGQQNQEHRDCYEDRILPSINFKFSQAKENEAHCNARVQPFLGNDDTMGSNYNVGNKKFLNERSVSNSLSQTHRGTENDFQQVTQATYNYPHHEKIKSNEIESVLGLRSSKFNTQYQRSPRFIDDNIMKAEERNYLHKQNHGLYPAQKQHHNCFTKNSVGTIHEMSPAISFSYDKASHASHSEKLRMQVNNTFIDPSVYDRRSTSSHKSDGALMKTQLKQHLNPLNGRVDTSYFGVNTSKFFNETYSSPEKMYSRMLSKENSLFQVSPRSFLMGDRNKKQTMIYCNSLQRS